MRNRLAILPLLMMLTIVGIAAFQTYWLRKAYEREHHTTEVRLNAAFRETVFEEHAKKLRLDQLDTCRLLQWPCCRRCAKALPPGIYVT